MGPLESKAFDIEFSVAVEYAKGLAILLVVFGHFANPYSGFIYTFHIPLFFFLAGLFINPNQSYKSYIKKSLTRLITPYLVFGIVGILVNALKNALLYRPQTNIVESLTGLFYWMDISSLSHYGFVLWFLPTIFVGRLVCFSVLKLLGTYGVIFLFVCVVIALSVIRLASFPFAIDEAVTALPWVSAAVIFSHYRSNLLNDKLVVFFIFPVLIYSVMLGVQPLDLADKFIGNLFVSLPYTLALSVCIIWLFMKLQKMVLSNGLIAVFGHLGRYSMLILIVHPYTNNVAYYIVEKFLNNDGLFLKMVLTLLMICVVVFLKLKHKHNFLMKLL